MPIVRRMILMVAWAWLAAWFDAPPAAAHAEYRPFSTNRYAVFDAAGEGC